MLRFSLAAALAIAISSSPTYAQPASKSAPKQERTAERFLNGTDADRDAMLKDVAKAISDSGYHDVAMVPWFVMIAKNRKGDDVMLLIDPVTLTALELDNPGNATHATEAAETHIPRLRN